jgi:hypothetical protein
MNLKSGRAWSWIFVVDRDLYPDSTGMNQELRFIRDQTYITGVDDEWLTVSRLPDWMRCD